MNQPRSGKQAGDVLAVEEHQACFVYGVVPAGTPVPDVPGLDDRQPVLLAEGELAALVDVIETDRPLGTRRDLLAYSRVLEEVAPTTAVIPIRFGSVLTDGAAVAEELLRANHDHFAGLLAELAGRQQFTVRARYHREVVLAEIVAEDREIAALREETRHQGEDASYPARVRLGELVSAALEAKRQVDGQQIVDEVAPYAVAHRVREAAGMDDLVDVALLVDNGQAGELEAAAESLAERVHERVRLQLQGPLPPYDFVMEQ